MGDQAHSDDTNKVFDAWVEWGTEQALPVRRRLADLGVLLMTDLAQVAAEALGSE